MENVPVIHVTTCIGGGDLWEKYLLCSDIESWRRFREKKIVISLDFCHTRARFHVTVITQINKSVVYFIVRHNVKCGCSEC